MQQFNSGGNMNPPQKNNTGVIIGVSVGVVIGLIMLILGIVFVKKMLLISDSSTTETTTESTTESTTTEATTEATVETTEAVTEAPTVEASTQQEPSTEAKKDEAKDDRKDDKKDNKKDDKTEDPYDDSNYIIPNSGVDRLTDKDIMNMNLTLQEINYAKNEIYARHGRKFKSKELSDYFNSQPWYKGTIDPDKFSDSMLSATESANAKLLSDIEFSIDPRGYQLDQ